MNGPVTKDEIEELFGKFSESVIPDGLKASLVIVGHEETESYRDGIDILRGSPSVIVLGYDYRVAELDNGVSIQYDERINKL